MSGSLLALGLAAALASSPGRLVLKPPAELPCEALHPLLVSPNGLEPAEAISTTEEGCAIPASLEGTVRFLLAPATPSMPALLVDPTTGGFRLPPKEQREAVIVSELGGQPVPGVSVVFTSEELLRRLEGNDPGSGCLSGVDGRARGFAWKGDDLVLVRATGYETVLARRAGPDPIVVRRAGTLSGSLLNASGKPLGSRVVTASIAVAGTRRWAPIARARTDAAGRFRFETVGDGMRVELDDGTGPPAMEQARGDGTVTLRVPPEASVSLRVRGPEGATPEGTVLAVRQFSSQDPTWKASRRGSPEADGSALVRGLSGVLDRTIVEVLTPEGLGSRIVLARPLRELEDLGTVVLPPFGLARGSAASASGAPVAGAAVTDRSSGRLLATSDARGAFRLPVPADGEVRARIEAPGFLPEEASFSAGRFGKIVLKERARVTAKLRLGDGSVPKRARLVAVTFGFIEEMAVSAEPDADGRFTFELAPGEQVRRVDAEGAEGLLLGSLHLSPGDQLDLGYITLSSGAVVTGRVLDDETSLPLVGATVTAQAVSDDDLYDLLREKLPGATTDSNGIFRVSGLPEGSTRVFLEAPGRPVVRIDAMASIDGVDAGDVRMGRGRPLELRVLRGDGTPLADTRIGVRPGGVDGTLKETLLRTDASGACRLERVAPGRAGFVADTPYRQHRLTVVLSEVDGAYEWTTKGATIRGAVFDAGGKPLENVRVELDSRTGAGLRMLDLDRRTADGVPLGRLTRGDASAGSETLTDRDGRFAFEDVSEGVVRLLASAGSTLGTWQAVSVPPTGEVVHDLVFAGEPLSVTLVRDEDGVPCEGRVRLTGTGGQELSRASSPGLVTFLLPTASAARCVTATDAQGRSGTTFPEAGTRPVVVRVGAQMGDLAFFVRDSSGRPAAATHLSLLRSSDSLPISGVTDVNGTWRRAALAAGRYRVLARGPGAESRRLEMDVLAGSSQIPIELRPTGSLSLLVETDDPFDPRNTRVSVLDGNGIDRAEEQAHFGRPARLDSEGRYRLPALEAGRYSVNVRLGLVSDHDLFVVIEGGRTTEKRINAR